jgi:hypothetical protein
MGTSSLLNIHPNPFSIPVLHLLYSEIAGFCLFLLRMRKNGFRFMANLQLIINSSFAVAKVLIYKVFYLYYLYGNCIQTSTVIAFKQQFTLSEIILY